MKPLRRFISMSPEKDDLIKVIQEACAEDCVKVLMKIGEWDFEIDRNKSTQWWNAWIVAEYEVWRFMNVPALEELKSWVDDHISYTWYGDRSNEGSSLPKTGGSVPETT